MSPRKTLKIQYCENSLSPKETCLLNLKLQQSENSLNISLARPLMGSLAKQNTI